jgi:hypothetical protein
MSMLPYIRETKPGLSVSIPSANTGVAIPIPPGAVACLLWFRASASDPTMIEGRVGFDQSATLVTGITGTDTELGYHPPMPVVHRIPSARFSFDARGVVRDVTHIHVASATAGAVVRGTWFFASDKA